MWSGFKITAPTPGCPSGVTSCPVKQATLAAGADSRSAPRSWPRRAGHRALEQDDVRRLAGELRERSRSRYVPDTASPRAPAGGSAERTDGPLGASGCGRAAGSAPRIWQTREVALSKVPCAALSLLLATACGDDSAPASQSTKCRALGWLAETDAEIGVDSLVMLDAAGELAARTATSEVIAARKPDVSASELAAYGLLLEQAKPPFAAASLDGVPPNAGTPEPKMPAPTSQGGGSLIEACLQAALGCQTPPECESYVSATDSWGFVLTHQAVWLLFAHWRWCSVPVDLEERRRSVAASIVKEAGVDPTPGDLYAERLAMLGHLGFGESYDPDWITSLRAQAGPSGCLRAAEGGDCSTHTTSLAVLALTHAGDLEECR